MGGIAFLIMLGGFAALMYWYVLNHERGADGTLGFLGLKDDAAPLPEDATAETPVRLEVPEGGEHYTKAPDKTGKWRPKSKEKAYRPVD